MNTFLKYAVATALVLGCSIDAHAQLHTRDGGAAIAPVRVNRTIVNNNYYGGGGYYGNRGTYNYNCTGCFPGAGPYDSSIAVAGIVAGASVLNNLINSTAQNRQPVYNGYPPNTVVVQQPQVVYQQARPQVVYQPTQNVIVEPQSAAPNLQGNCSSYITGQNPQGGNVYVSTCR